MQIRFDTGPDGQATSFAKPSALIRAETVRDVPTALAQIDAARADGKWLAGFASYELGYALEPKLSPILPKQREMPLICFGVYDAPDRAHPLPAPRGGLSDFAPRWSDAAYAQAFRTVHTAIGAGDIYQANLTFPVDVETEGSPAQIYAALAALQPVSHGALIEAEGLPTILSRSPELFFRTDSTGQIETRPMKGTQPRGDTPDEDARNKEWLRQDEKNRAENLMIVDLLRNDISRVALPGSVRVPRLFEIETYATVHQMTSVVQAQLRPDAQLSEIFQALFPCGSITGAPKIRAMEILADLEPWPRDIYCGTIGWAAPDGRSEFNVAIRTLSLTGRTGVLNVGGGVVWDSTAPSEYSEALWKARFARQLMLASA